MNESLEKVMKMVNEKSKSHSIFDFTDKIEVIHGDGSLFNIRHAFMEEYEDFLIVYSEHHLPLVFYKDDLSSYKVIN